MSILSIDIGMKNFAYCLIQTNNVIRKWEVVDIGKTPLTYLKMIDNMKLYTMEISKVVIEKQPTKNVKMKQFENMLHCYFIINGIFNKDSLINSVEIFNPQNKLGKSHVKGSKNYRERKKIAIELCKLFLNNKTQSNEINELFKNSKKKDDLSDCLLQGLVSMKYDIDSLSSNIQIKTTIKPRKPTDKQCKKGYSKSNLKFIFNNTNLNKYELFKDPLIQKAVNKHYKNSIDDAWKELYNVVVSTDLSET